MEYLQYLQMGVGEAENELPSLSNPLTWISYGILGCLVGLSQAGGIGGGPIISPVMMVLLGLPSRKAIWNTYIMLLGGSLGSFLRLGKERTSTGSSPLINYELVLITLPLLLAGAVLGVATGRWLPKIVVVIFLFIILVSVFLKTYGLYNRMRTKESSEPMLVELPTLTTEQNEVNNQLYLIQEREKRLYPLETIQELVLQVVIVLVITLLKGSQTIPSLFGIEYCSMVYHIFNILLLVIALYNVNRFKQHLIKEEAIKESVGYQFLDGRISLVMDDTVKNSLFAGFLGGLVGLGGGVVLTPLWLGMGIASPRATASATFCVLFTSFISVFIIAYSGGYTIDEFMILGFVSCFGSYLVSGYLKHLVKQYKRESILIQVLLCVIAFGLVILPFQSIKSIWNNPQNAIKMGHFC